MILEEFYKNRILELQEWELVSYCNYKCFYCSLPKIKTETDINKLKNFMDNLRKDLELFCFGGEPFLHPKIKFIINYLKKINQPFVFQSNLSLKSLDIIKKNNLKNFTLQGSIHPTELSIKNLRKTINNLIILIKKNKIKLRRIDVMYSCNESIQYYQILINSELNKNTNIYLIPISGFYENDSCYWTKKYIELKNNKKYSWINFEEGNRIDIWYLQCQNKLKTKGRICPYNYILYDSMLNKYDCCYRENTQGICQHDRCFWM